MHASRKFVRLTTTAVWLALAACGSSSPTGSDAGCAAAACTGPTTCPTLTCQCGVVGFGDGGSGGETTQTRMIAGECTSGCCAPCPADCT